MNKILFQTWGSQEKDICLVKFVREKSRLICIRDILKDLDYNNGFE